MLRFHPFFIFLYSTSYEMIYKLVPEFHKKMVWNLKKQHERAKRRKAVKDALANPEDDDGEESALVPSKPKPET